MCAHGLSTLWEGSRRRIALSSLKRAVSSRITAATPSTWLWASVSIATVKAIDIARPSLCRAGTRSSESP
jgi:hypothetical protein